MALIKSISGIRGTIGGEPSKAFTPIDMVKYAAAYGTMLLSNNTNTTVSVVVGRDARISGAMVNALVTNTLIALGINVIDIGLSTTPTVEMAVKWAGATGGIILTASHNPAEWNALKLLNHKGEFISAADGETMLAIAESNHYKFANVTALGTITTGESYMQQHIQSILNLPLVNAQAIANANFTIVVDAINSTGATFVPALLQALGVQNITVINSEVNGNFAHNPEPLPGHLTQLSNAVVAQQAHLGIAVDPDVDRLCFVNNDGTFFGEEYTLVAVADYVLTHTKGATVSNLSSTQALADVTEKHGCRYEASAVGEVNVVTLMKETNAIIGGEGNGGIIYPELHYGRDALVGIALFLSHLANTKLTMVALKNTYPNYTISKNKIELTPDIDIASLFAELKIKYSDKQIIDTDGLKIFFDKNWVHLRPSNTEPIIRIYSESESEATANRLAELIITDIKQLINA